MSTTIGGVRIVDMPDLGAANDSSSLVGERAGSGRFSAPALRNYVRLNDYINVKDYGAIGNGTTDDTAAIQAAINAAPAGGATVFFPRGTYRVTASGAAPAFEISGNYITLLGEGPGATMLTPTSTTNDLFLFAGQFYRISNLGVTPPTSCTNGVIFNFEQGNCWMDHVYVRGGWDIVQYQGGVTTFISDCAFYETKCNGVAYLPAFAGWGFISSLNMANSTGNSGCGILVQGGDTFEITNVQITGFNCGVSLHPPTSTLLKNLLFTNVTADGINLTDSDDMWQFDGRQVGANLARIRMVNCWGGSGFRCGMQCWNVNDLSITNCIFINNYQAGLYLQGNSNHVRVSNSSFCANSQQAAATFAGIQVAPVCTNLQIIGNRSGPIPYGMPLTDQQRNGILIVAGATDYYIISNNLLQGNSGVALEDDGTGTHKVVTNNILT